VTAEAQTRTKTDGPAARTAPTGRRSRRKGRQRVTVLSIQIGLLVGLLGLWQVLADKHVIDTFFFGEPTGIWDQLYTWVTTGTPEGPLWDQIWITLQETLIGFGIGVALGVTCGIVLGRIPFLARVFNVYIGVFNSIPRIVLGSVFIIWFGIGMASKVALAVLLVFFCVFFNAFQGAREVDRVLVANARILGAGNLGVLRQVVLPSTFTWIIASLRVAFGLAITGAIVGELLGAQQGLGTLIAEAQGNFNPDGVYAGLVVTSIVALTAEGLITALEHRVLRWRPPRQSLQTEL
jgi:NitT/TauT family transport system permease protein